MKGCLLKSFLRAAGLAQIGLLPAGIMLVRANCEARSLVLGTEASTPTPPDVVAGILRNHAQDRWWQPGPEQPPAMQLAWLLDDLSRHIEYFVEETGLRLSSVHANATQASLVLLPSAAPKALTARVALVDRKGALEHPTLELAAAILHGGATEWMLEPTQAEDV